jgi:hypothetical protein
MDGKSKKEKEREIGPGASRVLYSTSSEPLLIFRGREMEGSV